MSALVPSPLMRAMQDGQIARVEELTRIPSDVQDALITILSEKAMPIPELRSEVQAVRGFNVIATANNRDRGVNEPLQRAQAEVQHGRLAAAGHRGRRDRYRPHSSGGVGTRARVARREAAAGGGAQAGYHLPRAARWRHRRWQKPKSSRLRAR